jgi:hypothetical protein
MNPVELAAIDAEIEADALRAEAERAMRLEDQSAALYDAATDAIEAYQRARDRAQQARNLADHYTDAYNVWHASRGGAA